MAGMFWQPRRPNPRALARSVSTLWRTGPRHQRRIWGGSANLCLPMCLVKLVAGKQTSCHCRRSDRQSPTLTLSFKSRPCAACNRWRNQHSSCLLAIFSHVATLMMTSQVQPAILALKIEFDETSQRLRAKHHGAEDLMDFVWSVMVRLSCVAATWDCNCNCKS